MGRRAINKKIGTLLRRAQKSLIAGKFVSGGETIERPCLSSGPARIVSPTLVRRLPQKFACIQVKNSFMGGTAVAAHQITSGGQTMLNRHPPQCIILRCFGRIEDQSDVHHDVDEQAFWRHERTEITPVLLETQGERASSINHDLILGWITGEFVPDLPGWKEKETE